MTKRRDAPKSSAPGESAVDRANYMQHLDQRLDEALEETFPASDSIAVTPRRNRGRRVPTQKPATTKPPG